MHHFHATQPHPQSKNEIFKEKTQEQPQFDRSYKKIYIYKKIYLYILKCWLQSPTPPVFKKRMYAQGKQLYIPKAARLSHLCQTLRWTLWTPQYLNLIVQLASSVNISPTGPAAGRLSIDDEWHLCQLGGPVGKRERNSRKKKITKSLYTIIEFKTCQPDISNLSPGQWAILFTISKKHPEKKCSPSNCKNIQHKSGQAPKNGARSLKSPHVASTF